MNNTLALTTENTTELTCSASCLLLAGKDAEIEKLRAELASSISAYEKLEKKHRRLNSAAAIYKHMLFEQSSEKSKSEEQNTPEQEESGTTGFKLVPKNKRKRGAQPGHKGHGRKIPVELETIYKDIEVPEEERFCPICNQQGEEVTLTEDSNEIDCEIKLFMVKTRRKRIKFNCGCENTKRFITAPRTPKAIPKSKLSHNLLALLIVLKYMFAIPINRVLDLLALQGEILCAGTVTGAFRKCLALFEPLYQTLVETSKTEKRWNVDETSWLTFIHLPGKKNYLTWMWVFISQKVVLYIWDPSRSSSVPLEHLGKLAQGFITVDRYSAYKKLAKLVPGLKIAFCWVHFRRDFLRASLSDKTLEPWALQWKERIKQIFRLNRAREKDPSRQKDLEAAICKMENTIHTELKDPALNELQQKVLKSAQRHWEGLTVFVKHPEVPMHNNIAEQQLRITALGRNNYYGSRAKWSSRFTAICLSLVKTAQLHGLNPQEYLRYYLDACGRAGGAPEDLKPYLPWNLTKEMLKGEKSC